jgi:hypothetical protein
MYWLNRLHEIRDEAHAAQEENLGQYAIDAIEYMVNSVKERNSAILRTYQSGGPDLHQDPHLLCLATELPDKQQGQNRLICLDHVIVRTWLCPPGQNNQKGVE